MNKPRQFVAALLVAGALNSAAAGAGLPRRKYLRCGPGAEWIKKADEYLRGPAPAPGKEAAVFATVSLVSLEPAGALAGQSPDRTGMWYAHGRLSRVDFPGDPVLQGTLPLWINTGDPKAPFMGGNGSHTLRVTVKGDGDATLHFQADGRNRLGKGPQAIQMSAVPSGSSAATQMFSATADFHGQKLIVLSLTRGQADAPAAPAPPKQARGIRYRITPSFVVTGADDGAGDDTLEVRGHIYFNANNAVPGKLVTDGIFNFEGDRKAGGRFEGTPFTVDHLFGQPQTRTLIVTGSAHDKDTATGDDELWSYGAGKPSKIVLQVPAGAKSRKAAVPGLLDGDSGALEITIEKVEDLF